MKKIARIAVMGGLAGIAGMASSSLELAGGRRMALPRPRARDPLNADTLISCANVSLGGRPGGSGGMAPGPPFFVSIIRIRYEP